MHSRSVGARYHGASNGEGRFEIRNVRASEDYRLWVYPRTGYKDKTIERVDVQPGENAIRVVLEPVDRGVLEGVVLDARRRPVARLTLHIRSMQSLANSITTTTNQRGYFRVEDAPAGDILMETRALPKISVRGIHLEAGTTQTVSGFTTNGSSGNLAILVSDSAGSKATLSKASGIVSVDYMSLKDSEALGGASWYAGANSTNVSGNTAPFLTNLI